MCGQSERRERGDGDVPRRREISGAWALLRRRPATIQSAHHYAEATPGVWLLVERAASFEGRARFSPPDANAVSFRLDGDASFSARRRLRGPKDDRELAVRQERPPAELRKTGHGLVVRHKPVLQRAA